MKSNAEINPDEITVPSNPDERVQSQYGSISYLHWCELEAARINRPTMPATVAYRDGKVYVSRREQHESV